MAGSRPLGHHDEHHPHHRRAQDEARRPIQSGRSSSPAPLGKSLAFRWTNLLGAEIPSLLSPFPSPSDWTADLASRFAALEVARPVTLHPLQAKQVHKKSSSKKKTDLVKLAFDRAKQLGWIPLFQEAAKTYGFTPELLMAIGYRESGLNPKYLKESGDNGHGYGIMQADIRAYPEWIKAGKWKIAKECINKGAEVLASKKESIDDGQGKTLTVKTLSGTKYTFVGAKISGDDLLRVAVAAYNCGLWAYYHFSKGHDIDRGTTGKDYSHDVLQKAKRFAVLLQQNPQANK